MKNKKPFSILKYFFIEEIRLIIILFISSIFISIYIYKNDLSFSLITYDISIAFLTGIILYFFLIFLPKISKRKNAQRELNIIINDLIKLFSLIIENYYSDEELRGIRFRNNPKKYIYDNIDEISKYIENNLKLDDIIKFKWNKDRKLTLNNNFFKVVNKFNVNYREIILKYGDYLEKETLDNLEQIYKNHIFINIREYDYLSQNDIREITIKKLLQDIYSIQKTADRINNICKK